MRGLLTATQICLIEAKLKAIMSNTDIKDITQISVDNQVITLINVFTVEPQNQERLIKILEQATDEVMRHLPGFVSANIQEGSGLFEGQLKKTACMMYFMLYQIRK
jgi:antibiotic biosynthesis monooxygenase (ABM) superfamily enzyme